MGGEQKATVFCPLSRFNKALQTDGACAPPLNAKSLGRLIGGYLDEYLGGASMAQTRRKATGAQILRRF